MNKAILMKADDWEGLYINGTLVTEGHILNEGNDRSTYFTNLSISLDFNLLDMETAWVDPNCEEKLKSDGSLPCSLVDVGYTKE
jgi:hypothetical protein